MEFVLITGLSGGGKSQAAGILEDMGFYCVDNLPAELMPRFADLCLAAEEKYDKVALVSDIRGKEGFGVLLRAVDEITAKGVHIRVLYLEASTETILNRYKETRHRHPLDREVGGLEEAIQRERVLTKPLKDMADLVIDTTDYPLNRLRQRLQENFGDGHGKNLHLNVLSFGFKYGIPAETDLLLDVRFLPNPFYVPELKHHTGLDKSVQDYVLSAPQTGTFLEKLRDLLEFLVPQYEAEGRHSLMIAVGCTGGKHRSVTVALQISAMLEEMGYPASCAHRDLS